MWLDSRAESSKKAKIIKILKNREKWLSERERRKRVDTHILANESTERIRSKWQAVSGGMSWGSPERSRE